MFSNKLALWTRLRILGIETEMFFSENAFKKSDQQARAVAKYSNISVDCARRKVLLIHVR